MTLDEIKCEVQKLMANPPPLAIFIKCRTHLSQKQRENVLRSFNEAWKDKEHPPTFIIPAEFDVIPIYPDQATAIQVQEASA